MGQAHALSLGPINVQSALGEPLRAEVDVSDISTAEAENLRLTIASAEAFRQAGIAYNQALTEVRASLQRRADGRYVIRLAGTRPLSDPFVDLLLEANWNSGRMVRDYTLLLDPPGGRSTVALAPQGTAPGSAPAAPRPAPAEPQPATRAPEAADASPPPAAAPAPAKRPAPAAAPIPPMVSPGPAPAARTASAPRAAPDAAGTPTATVTASVDRQITVQRGDTAGEIARVHKPAEISLDQMLLALLRSNPDAFIGGNVNRIRSGAVLNLPTATQAGAVPPAEARQAVTAQSRDFGEYRRRLAENAPASQVAPPDRQVTGRLQANVEDRGTAPPSADRLTVAQGGAALGKEEAALKAREAQEGQARLAELSRNLNDLSKLAAGSNPTTTVAAAAAPALSGSAAAASTAVATPASAAPPTSQPPSRPASAAAPGGVPLPAAGPAPERSFIDALHDNKLVLVAFGLVLLLIVLLAYRIRERRKLRHTGESLFQESELPAASFPGITGGESIDTHNGHVAVSALSYTPSQLDAGDVDPVAEADVYLAYGRDLQAEEILRDALRLHPERTAIHLKLLEIHAKRRDLRAYEALARSVREITRGVGPDWKRAMDMGQALDPGNPLYGDTTVAAAAAPPALASAFTPTVAPLDFDLNLDDEPLPSPPTASLPPAATTASLPPLPALDAASDAPPPKPLSDAGLLDFDLSPLGNAFDADGESPHAIKLALARELQALGDAAGARSLAEEVAVDGSGDLQAEAVRLLSQLH